MAEETPAEFRARMASIGIIRGGRTRPLEKTIFRPAGAELRDGDNRIDAGRKAKVTISEDRDIVLTTSDNRQDVNIFGKAAAMNAAGEQ